MLEIYTAKINFVGQSNRPLMSKKIVEDLACSLCGRATPAKHAEKHHLVPRSKGGTDTIDVCRNCGDQVHKLFSNNELRDEYNTLEKLRTAPGMEKWIRWVRKQDSFTFSMKSPKGRRSDK
ncbi:HNH endonuclease [Cerasicoccus frondis]|uniref:HNH endonuclease n=1 Tax=Cerasicoccus frondis TaxID=490090 RepID=UPI00285265B0|nr:HNH endonuclease signature motif containing protein [Cerasicoccus frondis]